MGDRMDSTFPHDIIKVYADPRDWTKIYILIFANNEQTGKRMATKICLDKKSAEEFIQMIQELGDILWYFVGYCDLK
jgi:hypothetical protein